MNNLAAMLTAFVDVALEHGAPVRLQVMGDEGSTTEISGDIEPARANAGAMKAPVMTKQHSGALFAHSLVRMALSILILMTLAIGVSAPARADTTESASSARAVETTEWRAMGAAFSYHFSDAGQLSKRSDPSWSCDAQKVQVGNNPDGSLKITSQSLAKFATRSPGDPKTRSAQGQVATYVGSSANSADFAKGQGSSESFRAVGSYSYDANTHVSQFTSVDCTTTGLQGVSRVGFHQNNPAIGVQRIWRTADHADKLYATIVWESYGQVSVMAGGGRQWPVLKAGPVSAEAGFVAGFWYRTKLDDDGFGLHRALEPFIVPAMSLNEVNSGIGIDIALAPKLKVNGHVFNAPTTLMFQFTYLIRTDAASAKKVTLQSNASGGIEAAFSTTF